MVFAGREPEPDVAAGDWIAAAAAPFGTGVAAFVPPVFEAYARVLHPAVRYDGDDDVEVPWAEVAAANGTLAHPLVQWPAVTGGWAFVHEMDQSPVWDRAPDEGHLPTDLASRLAQVLRRHTATPEDCWFGVWAGWGHVTPAAAALALPGREFWLLRGPVELATANLAPEPSEQSAHLWWPADRSWYVATDIDLMSTYVGGSGDCIADLIAAPGLEAFPAAPADPVDWAADRVNPPPAGRLND